MKFLVIFLTVPILAISAALTARDVVQFRTVSRQCGKEFTVDPTAIDRARAGEMVNDPEFNCLVACILEGINLMRPDGTLNADAAVSKIPDLPFHDSLVEAIRSCATQRGRNKCDTAYRLYACMHERGVPDMLTGN